MVHLLKFALFGLNMRPVVRATEMFIFLVGLGIMCYTTRRGMQHHFLLSSSGNWRRWRRRHHAHAWLDRKHSKAHATHTCKLQCMLSTCLLVLFFLFLRSWLCWDCHVPFCCVAATSRWQFGHLYSRVLMPMMASTHSASATSAYSTLLSAFRPFSCGGTGMLSMSCVSTWYLTPAQDMHCSCCSSANANVSVGLGSPLPSCG